MNVLLDTHALLWWLDDNPQLSKAARDVIANGDNLVFISAAVIWEIRIKQALHKIKIPRNFQDQLNELSFEKLDISAEHAHAIARLPNHHRDPFDRMLITQAMLEKLAIVTRDKQIIKYDVPVIKT